MKKKIRLTESELTNLIKQVVVETKTKKRRISEQPENFFNPESMDTADAIYTIIGTTIGMLGIAGYDILKDYAKGLMKSGKRKEAKEMMSAIKDLQSKGIESDKTEMGKENKRRLNELPDCPAGSRYCTSSGKCCPNNTWCMKCGCSTDESCLTRTSPTVRF